MTEKESLQRCSESFFTIFSHFGREEKSGYGPTHPPTNRTMDPWMYTSFYRDALKYLRTLNDKTWKIEGFIMFGRVLGSLSDMNSEHESKSALETKSAHETRKE